MKNRIKYILQKILGYRTYLYWFSLFKINTLKGDKKEGDFFYFMKSINQPGQLLDIGANIGIMTYHLSKQFPTRKIYAIEPMPDNLAVLERVIKSKNLKNVEVFPFAVGQESATLEMVLPIEGQVKMQGLAHVLHESIDEWNEGEKFNVKSITLDQEFEDIPIAGIKMDIENFEYFALLGGQRMIEKYKPVIYLELWPNEGRDKCFDLLNKIGYEAFIVEQNKLIKFNPAVHQKQNFVFKV